MFSKQSSPLIQQIMESHQLINRKYLLNNILCLLTFANIIVYILLLDIYFELKNYIESISNTLDLILISNASFVSPLYKNQ